MMMFIAIQGMQEVHIHAHSHLVPRLFVGGEPGYEANSHHNFLNNLAQISTYSWCYGVLFPALFPSNLDTLQIASWGRDLSGIYVFVCILVNKF